MATSSEDAARQRLRELSRAPDPGTSAGREQQLAEIRQLSASIKEARYDAVVGAMNAKKAEGLGRWSMSPPGSSSARRARRGSQDPSRESIEKILWLYRSGLPRPLEFEDVDERRLSSKEATELLALTQTLFRGGPGYGQREIQRQRDLLEKLCDRPGAIAWVEQNLIFDADGKYVGKREEVKDGGSQ